MYITVAIQHKKKCNFKSILEFSNCCNYQNIFPGRKIISIPVDSIVFLKTRKHYVAIATR